MVSGTHASLKKVVFEVDWEATVALKGWITYAFTHIGNFLLLCPSVRLSICLLEAQIPVMRPKSQSCGPNPSHTAPAQMDKGPQILPLPTCIPLR